MKKNVIQLMGVKHRTFYQRNGHKLHDHGRLAWLHRLLWRALLRMGAITANIDETVKVIRVPINDAALFDRIRTTLDYLYSSGFKPREVLMGPETFAELMNAPETRNYTGPFQFDTRYGFNRSLFGLKVEVLPQMEGLLVR